MRAGQRRVGVPAELRRAAWRQEAHEEDDPAEREQVVAQQVEPGEGHVGRADLQRHELVREPDEQRRREQQQHDRAVHGEQLVVLRVGDDRLVRPQELDPDQHRHDPREQEEHERRDQVHVPDDLVVRGRQPSREDRALALGPLRPVQRGAASRLVKRGHVVLPAAVLWSAFCWAIHVWNCDGVTILSVKSIRLW